MRSKFRNHLLSKIPTLLHMRSTSHKFMKRWRCYVRTGGTLLCWFAVVCLVISRISYWINGQASLFLPPLETRMHVCMMFFLRSLNGFHDALALLCPNEQHVSCYWLLGFSYDNVQHNSIVHLLTHSRCDHLVLSMLLTKYTTIISAKWCSKR